MVAQLLEVLRQGIWASLTGGYFYEPQNNSFCNVTQLYSFMLLVGVPFSLYLSGTSLEGWIGYVTTLTVVFSSTKFVNWQLHKLFDTKEVIEEVPGAEETVGEGEEHELKTIVKSVSEQAAVDDGDSSPSEAIGEFSEREKFVEVTVHEKSSSQDDFQEAATEDDKNEPREDSSATEQDDRERISCETEPPVKEESSSGHEKSPSIKESERPSMKSGISSVSSFIPTAERRFSNVSNLARSLASSSGGSAAFHGSHRAGSLELGYILEESHLSRAKSRKRSVRRTQSAVVTSPGIGAYEPPPSHIVSLDPIGRSDFLRPVESKRQPSASIKPIIESVEQGAVVNDQKTESEKELVESRSDIERKSVERTRKSPSTSNKNLDKPLQVTFASEFTVVPINIESDLSGTASTPSREESRNSVSPEKVEGTSAIGVSVLPDVSLANRDCEGSQEERDSNRWSVTSLIGLGRLFRQGESTDELSFSYQAIPTASDHPIGTSYHSLSGESDGESDPKSPLLGNPHAEGLGPSLPQGYGASRSELGKLLMDILSKDSMEDCERDLAKLRETLSRGQLLQDSSSDQPSTLELHQTLNDVEERSSADPESGPSTTLDLNWTLHPWSPSRTALKMPRPLRTVESLVPSSRTPTPPLGSSFYPVRPRPRLSRQATHDIRQQEYFTDLPLRAIAPWSVYSIEARVGSGGEPLTQIGPLPLPPMGLPWVTSSSGDTSIAQAFTTVRSDRFPSPGGSSLNVGGVITDSPNVSFVRNRLRTYSRRRRREHLQLPSTGGIPSTSPDYFHPLTLHAIMNALPSNATQFEDLEHVEEQIAPKRKRYYKLKLCHKSLKIRYDRLQLLALLDRNWTVIESVLSVIMAVLVAVLGGVLLSRNLCHGFTAFLLSAVIGGCQYSLFKSVQPDASSPMHGFNRLVPFSRASFFCAFSLIVILLDMCVQTRDETVPFLIYGFNVTSIKLWAEVRDLILLVILCFPLIFTLGMLPQISTFAMYFLEQTDIHVFGGSAVTGLLSAAFAILRSVFLVTSLYGLAFAGLKQPEKTQHVLFSIFSGILVSSCYHISRYSSDPNVLISMAKKERTEVDDSEFRDPLPEKLRSTVMKRLRSDIIMCILIGVIVFAVHVSTVFTVLQKPLSDVLWLIAVALGFLLHYIIPQARKKLPWSCFAHPFLKPDEYNRFEVSDIAKLMWFEKLYVWFGFFEKNILYIVLHLCALTRDSPRIVDKFGIYFGTLVVVICAVKCIRSTLNNPAPNYTAVLFAMLLFEKDMSGRSETFLIDYCLMLTICHKVKEMLLKLQFVITYVAPWNIAWGSAFHAFAHPVSIPHSAMLFVQAAFSSIFSAPLSPFFGSSIFTTSYARPIKFWERDYNTKRIDSSNTRLVSQLEQNLGSDDNNLNSIFYEKLTRSLQHSLAGDLTLGRWGDVEQGDCFILTSDNMNCLVHIIEVSNGLVTFQLRGMEFRGTYCQQREIEAITEDVEGDQGCCCCEPGHLPHMLSGNAAFVQRWLAWEVAATKYVVEGYTVSDNNAANVLQVYDLRKLLITFYVKAVIYFALTSPKLEEWLEHPVIVDSLSPLGRTTYVDVDPTFNKHFDEDFDYQSKGISRSSFTRCYLDWIAYCAQKRTKKLEVKRDSMVVSFCMGLCLLARRCLSSASPKALSSVDFFLHCLHSLFKGDFRVTCPRDEWVFTDMDLLKKVVAPAVKMSVKLHQDHFMYPDEYDDPQSLFDAIADHQKNWFISHEGDPAWRAAVLSGVPSLLALRHVVDETTAEYKIVMLNRRWLSFRVIKLNRECVRGFWAGQQQELVFLRNRHAERGSIQNAKQVLRNIINSSCDQPIGYPIFVSPLTTSYADTHPQLCRIIGGPIEWGAIQRAFRNFWLRLRRRCREGCVSGGSAGRCDESISMSTLQFVSAQQGRLAADYYIPVQHCGVDYPAASIMGAPPTLPRGSRGSLGTQRGSVGSNLSTTRKPSGSTLVSLAGLLAERETGPGEPSSLRHIEYPVSHHRKVIDYDLDEKLEENLERPKRHLRHKHESSDDRKTGESSRSSNREDQEILLAGMLSTSGVGKAVIVDVEAIYDSMNLGRRIDPVWPCEEWRALGGRNTWKYWVPDLGMEGEVVHMWIPYHHIPEYRSPVFRKILLLRMNQFYVPVAENGVKYLGNYQAVIDPDLKIFRPIRKQLPGGVTIKFERTSGGVPVKPPRVPKLEYQRIGVTSEVGSDEELPSSSNIDV